MRNNTSSPPNAALPSVDRELIAGSRRGRLRPPARLGFYLERWGHSAKYSYGKNLQLQAYKSPTHEQGNTFNTLRNEIAFRGVTVSYATAKYSLRLTSPWHPVFPGDDERLCRQDTASANHFTGFRGPPTVDLARRCHGFR